MKNKYRWSGIQKQSLVTGKSVAYSITELKHELKQQQIETIQIRTINNTIKTIFKKKAHQKITPLWFIQQLSPLIQQQFHLADSLKIIADSNPHPLWKQLHHAIMTGSSLTEALEKHTRFEKYIITLIAIGEKTGNLKSVLLLCQKFLLSQKKIKDEIKKALRYPLFLLSLTIIITYSLLSFILPQFQNTFSQFGAKLPILTQHLIRLSTYIQHHRLLIVTFTVITLIACSIVIKKPKLRQYCDHLLGIVPLIKSLQNEFMVLQICSIMSLCLCAKLSLSIGIDLCLKSFNNLKLQSTLSMIAENLQSGSSFSQAFLKLDILNSNLRALIQIADSAGNLEAMLSTITEQQQHQLSQRIQKITKLLEPTFMILISIIIGTIVIAMYLPIFQMGNAI